MRRTARRTARRKEAELGFDALSIEGGLLSPEWLSRAAQLGAGQQTEADYAVPKGCNIRDEIGRYWRIAQAHWAEFAAGRTAGADAATLSERFVPSLLRESYGFGSLAAVGPVTLGDRICPIGFAALGGRVPVVVAPADVTLDDPLAGFGDGSRRRSAFGLAQEFLNAEEKALWGLATNGMSLRIVRDNESLTRPSWIEADLARIFEEQRFSDFAALWLIAHETRFGRPDRPATECALEEWRTAGREEGTRAREHLRHGVEEALKALGGGFLAHAANQELRAALQGGSLATKDFFSQLLRLVYRLIFLLTVEERGLLHPTGADKKVKDLYEAGYGLRRLRERSVRRSAHDRHSDLWESLKIVFRGVASGEPRLGLPALAGIFAPNRCPALDAAKLENRFLLLAVFRLAWLREESGLARVNWRDMGPEELGSVYESLLELVPQVGEDGRRFEFATGGEAKGHARKTTGSYYTPDSLVQVLLDSALDPVISETIAKSPDNPVDALLGLSVVDPACGSGHFLLAAARRLAAHVARLQAAGTPSAAEYRRALRQVVGRCVYGVDLNPMAVELCQVALWMEAVEPGLPLTFLDAHVRHGNALLGTTPELMAKGIPDDAWNPIEGDDRKEASALKKRNKRHADSAQTSWSFLTGGPGQESADVARSVAELDAASDADAEALAGKEARWAGILDSAAYRHQKQFSDAWCAAFVWPKQPGPLAEAAPTNEVWRTIRDGQPPNPLTVKTTEDLARQYTFFHWHLAFPQVFAKGGFDVVLGNPPWERIKLQEQEFFAARNPEIANAKNAAARKKAIAALADADPALWAEWCAASRIAEGESHSIRHSGRYPLCAKGDVNTYAIFAEHNCSVAGPRGRAGFIVPTGIATNDTTAAFISSLIGGKRLQSLLDFDNTAQSGFFPGVAHGNFRFALLTVGAFGHGVFVVAAALERVSDIQHHAHSLSAADIDVVNPNTGTCPTFRSGRDARINLAMYRRAGILWREHDEAGGNPWGLRFMRMLDMTNDSGLFNTRAQLEAGGDKLVGNRFVGGSGEYLPLFEAKMVHHFDHRYGDYGLTTDGWAGTAMPAVPLELSQDPTHQALPRYWVARHEVTGRFCDARVPGWLLGWHDITASAHQRTVVASLMPLVAVGNTTPLMLPDTEPASASALYANLCSFALDYAARQKLGGTHLNYVQLRQLPVLSPKAHGAVTSWSAGAVLNWLLPRVLELTYTAWDLEPFARDVGYDGPPFRWDPARRFFLRCELDAAFFHLYGIDRGDVDYIMDTFPIVKKNDEKAHGEYRTKRVILEIYDAMAEAARTGRPYETRLDPPPADPRVAHPDTRKKSGGRS
ncbi:MAG: N-6 DNA methylase [Deltaproteobacteria bacterium]|nr:N-6 DNA methylase [Deltaproteobacteria bacterium]